MHLDPEGATPDLLGRTHISPPDFSHLDNFTPNAAIKHCLFPVPFNRDEMQSMFNWKFVLYGSFYFKGMCPGFYEPLN